MIELISILGIDVKHVGKGHKEMNSRRLQTALKYTE